MDSTLTLLSLLFVVFIFIVWVSHSLSPKPYPSSVIKEAKKAYDEEKWDHAIALCTQAIQLEPGGVAFDLRASCYFNKSQWELAAADFTSAIELGESSTLYVNRGNCWRNFKKYDAALADFTSAIQLKPNGTHYFSRASLYVLLGDFQKAIDDLAYSILETQKALESESEPSPNKENLLSSYLAFRADIFLKKGDRKAAIADMDEAIKLRPKPEFYRMRGTFHQEDGNQTAALLDYQKIVTVVDADHLLLSPELYAVLKQGFKDAKDKKWEEAILAFSQVLKDHPIRRAFYERGRCYYWRKEWESALADFNAAIQVCPTDPGLYQMRGLTHQAMKAWRNAQDDFTLAIALTRNKFETYENKVSKATLARHLSQRSFSHYKQGQWDLAIMDMNEAIQLEPTPHRYSNRGLFHQCKGDHAASIEDREQALLIAPDYASANCGLAWLLATCEDDRIRNGEKALFHAKKAYEKEPETLAYIGTLAAAYAEAGHFPEAIKFAKLFLDSNPPEANLEPGRQRLALYEQGLPYREEKGKTETVER